jgi:pimeloyl-ACP methyl ester carboxylesterase
METIASYLKDYTIDRDSQNSLTYKGFFYRPEASMPNHCVLVLSGTSIQLKDIQIVFEHLLKKGYTVAAIERNIGHIININMRPASERLLSLKDFIHQLTEHLGVDRIDVIAQSYASFEIVRTLMDAPEAYEKHISSIVMVNPAGFDSSIRYVPHCLRFLFIHILSEYIKTIRRFVTYKLKRSTEAKYYRRKWRALNSFFIKTLQNPTRTFREIADIVSFDITPHLEFLLGKYKYPLYFVLNQNDNLVASEKTLSWSKRFVPGSHILVFPGNHLDSFIDENQVLVISELINKINNREHHA